MDFRLLGALEVWDGPRQVRVHGRLHPKILSGLLLNPGRVVPLSWLVDLLWDAEPPATARRQAQNAVAALRRQLAPGSPDLIERVGQGYRLNIADDAVDLRRFETLTSQARERAEVGDDRAACERFEQALGLWRGPALAGLSGRVLEASAARLDDLYLSTYEYYAEVTLACGRPERVLADLSDLTNRHPRRQRLAARLMHALYQADRTPEALRCYEDIQTRLADELGLDPSAELRDLRMRVLQNDPTLLPQRPLSADDRPRSGSSPANDPRASVPQRAVPSQLPADISTFTGRREQLAVLDRLRRSGAKAGIVSTIAGVGGVGKTALAVHWGHSSREHFPDGQLYVNLRGFDEREPLTPHDALTRLLRSLGHLDEVPSGVEEAAALYRSILADKRVLVVLDNARNPDQVRPLLPGTAGCLALLTSRNRLSALLISHDAQPVELDTLNPIESLDLLTRLVGAEGSVDSAALERMADLCGHLPLALRIAAANHTQNSHRTLAEYVRQLDEESRLASLSIDDDHSADLSAVFDQSYRTLTPVTRQVFVHMGLIPGEDFTVDLMASVANQSIPTTQEAFDELDTAHLLEQHRPGRYRLHDLVRRFAHETGAQILDDGQRSAAGDRMLDWYGDKTNPYLAEIDNVLAACEAFSTHRQLWKLANTLGLMAMGGGNTSRSVHFVKIALKTAERHRHIEGQICSLDALGSIRRMLGGHEEAIALHRAARNLLPHVHDNELHGKINNNLGGALMSNGQLHEAESYLRRAAEIGEAEGLTEMLIVSQMNLGGVYREMGRFRESVRVHLLADTAAEKLGSPLRRVGTLFGLGLTYYDLGRYEEALTTAKQALSVAEELSAARLMIHTTQLIGVVYHRMGAFEDAARYFDSAISLASRQQDSVSQVSSLQYQTELFLDTGKTRQAYVNLDTVQRILTIRKASGPETAFQARLTCLAHCATEDWKSAIQHGEAAVTAYRTTSGNPLLLARSLSALGDAHSGHGSSTTARDLWTEALDIFTELDIPEATQLRRKLNSLTSS